jgi:hypothetical protein
LNEKVAAAVKKTELTTGGFVALTTRHPLSAKVGIISPTCGGRSVGVIAVRYVKFNSESFAQIQIIVACRLFYYRLSHNISYI